MRPDLLILTLLSLAAPAAGDTAFVTCQNGDALSLLDLDSGKEIRRLPLPGKPAGIAVTPGAVFTVSADSKVVRRLDPGTLEVLAETTLDGGPIGVEADAARGRIFVSDWYNARIWVLDARTLALLQELGTGAAPAGLTLSPDGRWLASADRDADGVSIFDAETLALHLRARTGVRPFGLRFAPDGRLFVANVGSNDVAVLDPVSGERLAGVAVGERPYGVGFAAGRAFVTNQYAGTVSVIDLATLAPLKTLAVGEYPEGVDATSDGRIVIANWFDNSASLIDAETLRVTGEIATGDGPRAFGRFILGGEER